MRLSLSTERVTDLSEKEHAYIVDLLGRNMKELYEQSSWGWNEKNKREEMLDDAAWYLLAKDADGKINGFSHFRYDMDFDDEVLYVYEVILLMWLYDWLRYYKFSYFTDPIGRNLTKERTW